MAEATDAAATTRGRWKLPLAVAVGFASIYAIDLLYAKLIEDMGITPVDVFGGGLSPVHQFVVLLLMSFCFAAAVLLHPGEGV